MNDSTRRASRRTSIAQMVPDTQRVMVPVKKTHEEKMTASMECIQQSLEQVAPRCNDESSKATEIARVYQPHDLLSDEFLYEWLVTLQSLLQTRVGIVLTNGRGKVLAIHFAGWEQSLFRIYQPQLYDIARRAIQRSDLIVSNDILSDSGESNPSATKLDVCQPTAPLRMLGGSAGESMAAEAGPLPKRPNLSFCVNLNKLSRGFNAPLLIAPWKLERSQGYALLIVDMADRSGELSEMVSVENFKPVHPEFITLSRELDAWMFVRRCKGIASLMQRWEWLRSNPRICLLTVACLLIALLFPVPYFPNRECVIEPDQRQFIASPVAGRIAECSVRPGDFVEKGTLLAKLDEEEVQRELVTAMADREGAIKRFNAALASKSSGELGLAKVDIMKAETLIASLEERLKRMEVRATSSGIVILGDWHKNIGMPVTMGQILFELAELSSMNAEIHLEARDLPQISVGDRVRVTSEASGRKSFPGTISRIDPRASIGESKAYFVADVQINDPAMQLRPGMKATAQVNAGWRTIGWLLFSRPYRWIANQWVW